MNRFNLLLIGGLTCVANIQQLSGQIDESGNSYYVVIGAYAHEKNAMKFIKWAKDAGLNPRYELKETNRIYYVYTMKENNWGIPVHEAERIRKAFPKLDDAWVYHGILNNSSSSTTAAEIPVLPVNSTAIEEESTPVNESKKNFLFRLKAEDGKAIQAPIEIIDLDSSKLYSLFPSNESVVLNRINPSGRLMAQCKVFGYRLKQIEFSYNSPTDSAGITLDSGRYVVPVELKPLQEGDLTIMYNVFFYKDASIMRPDSKYEITALIEMMNEFPNRKIVIHGHTNGNWNGKILKPNESKDFFSLEDCFVTKGTALELSKQRALVIMDYLVSNGIASNRMTTKAWGGKKPLVHPDHERAIDNVRVEVEIARSKPEL